MLPYQVERDSRKETQRPEDRLRQMVMVLDSTLSDNRDLMEAVVEELEEAGVEHRVGDDGVPVGSVTWRRKQRKRNINKDAQVSVLTVPQPEALFLGVGCLLTYF